VKSLIANHDDAGVVALTALLIRVSAASRAGSAETQVISVRARNYTYRDGQNGSP
jgi:hypothetical protein